ncbi:MAG: hypothetical protein II467_00540 [Bacilli bacterium]|nr:hypothetical protein [Bacilli bacterium]
MFKEDGTNIDSLLENKKASVSALFLDNKEYLPYLTLDQYAALYTPFLKEDVRSSFEDDGASSLWKITRKDEKGEENLVFAAVFSYLTGQIAVGGNLSSWINVPSLTDISALTLGLKVDATYPNQDAIKNMETYVYALKDFPYSKRDDKYYLPLGLYDITFSNTAGLNISFDYDELLIYSDFGQLKEPLLAKEGDAEKTLSALDMIKEKIKDKKMPTYLAEYNRNCFFYLMDNFYGLAGNLGISSMRNHYLNSPFLNDFLSENPEIRQRALTRALNELDDGHTGLLENSLIWGETSDSSYPRNGKNCDRNILNEHLTNKRQAVFDAKGFDKFGIDYSESQETAFVPFDSFNFASTESDVVDKEKKNYLPKANEADAAVSLGLRLQEIKDDGVTQNVVIDLSVNGGGTIGVLYKALALISKDNSTSNLATHETGRNVLTWYKNSYDFNLDGVYDEEDCFGDDLNIYLLTSPYTFSCANAFAYASSLNGTAKIMGARSGGGECVVGSHILPNFQKVLHSSTSHIGYYNEEESLFFGDEQGAWPDIPVDYDDYYNVDSLEKAIKNSQNS